MWGPVQDYDIITDLTYNAFAWGRFIRVPLIVGDDTNGGTIFAPRGATTLAESDAFLHDQFPYLGLDHLVEVNALYPNGNDEACPDRGCYWRQVSDAYGDMRFMCPAMFVSSMAAQYGGGGPEQQRTWTYRYNVEDPGQMAEGLGVPHAVDVHAVFGPDNTGGGPASYRPDGVNAPVIPVVQAYWTSFIKTFNPNTLRLDESAEWETWNGNGQRRLVFQTGGPTEMETVSQESQGKCKYLTDIGADIKQ